jgi:2-oxoisovalerate dehydrogenase E2 component (dihydrolipoyl transacylase)
MPQRTFHLPDLGEGLTEAELLEWLVAVGDEVRSGQAIARVETDKAEVDVSSPWTGTVVRLNGEVGALIQTGEALVEFELPETDDKGGRGDSSRVAEAGGHPADAGTVVGKLPLPDAPPPHGSSPRAIPSARARARELGLALDSVTGTGPGRVITRADVERTAAHSTVGDTQVGEPMRGVRLAMARNMARSNTAVASATVMDDVDVDAWWSVGVDVVPRLVRAMVAGCGVEPSLNAWLDDQRMARVLHAQVDLALAIQSPDGLFAPVLRDVGSQSLELLRTSIDGLVQATQDRSLAPSDLRGGTITLSNFGRFGGRHAMLVVVPPQVAILGAGRIERCVRVKDEKAVVRSILPLSLSFDHRAVTGAEAARFLKALRADLEHDE